MTVTVNKSVERLAKASAHRTAAQLVRDRMATFVSDDPKVETAVKYHLSEVADELERRSIRF